MQVDATFISKNYLHTSIPQNKNNKDLVEVASSMLPSVISNSGSRPDSIGITGFNLLQEKKKPKKVRYFIRPDGHVAKMDLRPMKLPLESIMPKSMNTNGMSVDDMLDSIGTPTDRMKQ